jgi:stearoyl-CoA desaturase (delta-9 desaturase)
VTTETIAANEVIHTKRLNWTVTSFIVGTPIAAAIVAYFYVRWAGFVWTDMISFVFMYFATGLAITAGYHRYYSHRTFECHKIVQFLFLFFGTASVENSVINWASDHRYHHVYADRDGDPYNVIRGFWWAHIGWMFYDYPEKDRPYKNAQDLKKDPMVAFQDRHYLAAVVVSCFLFPMLIGALFGRPLAGLVWGGLVRMVVVHHSTYLINSWAHTFGKKTYDEKSTAADSHVLAAFTFGEGYHSFHHAYAGDYRIGRHWYDIDWGKWLILSFHRLGLITNLRKTYKDRSSSRGASAQVA